LSTQPLRPALDLRDRTRHDPRPKPHSVPTPECLKHGGGGGGQLRACPQCARGNEAQQVREVRREDLVGIEGGVAAAAAAAAQVALSDR
jgi:hypothetical protein